MRTTKAQTSLFVMNSRWHVYGDLFYPDGTHRKFKNYMTNDQDNTAYIRSERSEKTVKYIAKVFNQPPFEITKQQYNAIVKSLSKVEWATNEENEASVISKVISSHLEASD